MTLKPVRRMLANHQWEAVTPLHYKEEGVFFFTASDVVEYIGNHKVGACNSGRNINIDDIAYVGSNANVGV